jgi:hypothetical protein
MFVAQLGGGVVKSIGKALFGDRGPTRDTAVARTLAAQDGSALQRTLLQQVWTHANDKAIPDQGEWQGRWNAIAEGAAGRTALESLMASVSGISAPAFAGVASVTTGSKPSSPLKEVLAPVREGVAEAIERAALGGGAAAAKTVRGGEPGTLDHLIAVAKRPAVALTIAGVVVLLLVVGVVIVARKA